MNEWFMMMYLFEEEGFIFIVPLLFFSLFFGINLASFHTTLFISHLLWMLLINSEVQKKQRLWQLWPLAPSSKCTRYGALVPAKLPIFFYIFFLRDWDHAIQPSNMHNRFFIRISNMRSLTWKTLFCN